MSDNIEIKFSKTKLIFLLIALIPFVIIGAQGAIKPEDFVSFMYRSPFFIRISGISAVCFSAFCIFFLAQKIFDNKPGLIINQHGITNNSNLMAVGLIEWDDITRIEKMQVVSTRLLILYTNKPKKYINKTKNIIVRHTMKMNNKYFGSPLSITSNSLKIDFNDLEKIIMVEFEKWKKRS